MPCVPRQNWLCEPRQNWLAHVHQDETGQYLCTKTWLTSACVLRQNWLAHVHQDKTGQYLCIMTRLTSACVPKQNWLVLVNQDKRPVLVHQDKTGKYLCTRTRHWPVLVHQDQTGWIFCLPSLLECCPLLHFSFALHSYIVIPNITHLLLLKQEAFENSSLKSFDEHSFCFIIPSVREFCCLFTNLGRPFL